MDRDRLAQRLRAAFQAEREENLRALDRGLVELEQQPAEPQRGELFQELMRTAHNLKGAARAVGESVVEESCHELEEQLVAARPLAPEAWDPGLFARLFALVDRMRAAPAPAAPHAPALPEPAPATASETGFVRLPAAQIDTLLAKSGELSVARARVDSREETLEGLRHFVSRWRRDWMNARPALRRLQQTSAAPLLARQADNLARLESRIDRLAQELAADRRLLRLAAGPLDEEVRRARLLPLAEGCAGLERVVRDIAQAEGKDAELQLRGIDVEVDRAILEALRDPLVHLVRNAVAHGIETPATRRERGKPERGRVTVSAAVVGDHVEIAIEDDGTGLDRAAIRDAARRAGLPEPSSDADYSRLILSGLSTAREVTRVSGRGVGLDVVRRRVESVRGQVEVTTREGAGTRFSLRVPLTLTTIRALLVVAGGQQVALPATNVRRIVRAGPDDVRVVEGKDVVRVGGALLPLVSLGEVLGRERSTSGAERVPVVVVSAELQEVAYVVDELVGEREVVVKSLGARLRGLRLAAGALMLPTGRFALILKPSELNAAAVGRLRERGSGVVAPKPRRRRRRLRVLLADDSVTTRALERSILEAAGYEVTTASDGEEAWRLLQEAGADVLVSDVQMPRRDGFALTEAVRNSERFRHLPVVLVTGLASDEDRARGLEAGANAYLVKSAFDQQNLLDTVAQLSREHAP